MSETLSSFFALGFMNRALFAIVLITLTAAPLGVLLIQQRMSLMGEALSHGILPGVAIASIFFNASLLSIGSAGMLAGLLIALLSYIVAKKTVLYEDAAFSSFYLLALAVGVLLLSLHANKAHVMHFLFGNVLAINQQALYFILFSSCATLSFFWLCFRPLIYGAFDPLYMRSIGVSIPLFQGIFVAAVVLNLVAACQALGTLMALGCMMLPAATATLLSRKIVPLLFLSISIGILSGSLGLLIAYHYDLPPGPVVILQNGFFYVFAVVRSLMRGRF